MNPRTPEHWPRYRLYGVTMASDFPFANRLAPGSGACDLTFSRAPEDAPAFGLEGLAPAYAGLPHPRDGRPLVRLWLIDDDVVAVRIADVAEYYLYADRILYHLFDPSCQYLVEIHLLGHVFAIWLESRGVPALHASAVVADGRAVAFLAGNKGGKSSLAASLMQAGCPLLTDDILPLECTAEGIRGRPGYPQMRLWPDQAEHFLRHDRDLELVHPAYSKRRVPIGTGGLGAFCDRPAPLCCLYLPEMRNDGVDFTVAIEPVSPREAFAQLLRCSFIGGAVAALGVESSRLHVLAQVASTVPARRLRYAATSDRLVEVRQAILADFAARHG